MLSEWLFRRVGGSTGTNFNGVHAIAAQMQREGRSGALVTLTYDSGDRYAATCFNDDWLTRQKLDIAPWRSRIEDFLDNGRSLTA